jgi:phosphinothricin acetyltransferase
VDQLKTTDAAEARIREATPADALALASIYNHYVTNTTVTFEEQPVSAAEMGERLGEVIKAQLPFLVAESASEVIGFAYASKWKGRCAYRFSVETTVYLADGRQGRGIGSALYLGLISRLQDAGFHAAIGGIALPNDPSVALHEELGFAQVARFRQVGFKFNRWIDVGYWERLLEMPSADPEERSDRLRTTQ